ncbi:NAD kinase [Aerococcus agrisoli]|uniref:NAD kinase n=1 Tax=Aerococcus agrisoli TaxID=2487350 RepID=A0A3N4GDR4_9LACT|nr:NAD kinase [Aerococcus agrisoli]RPA60862.1 NAD kinase [Aerococcus agrisoli]
MRVAVHYRDGDNSKKIHDIVKASIDNSEFELDYENPELAISIGGDGTLLETFHTYADKLDTVRFVGVHTGHLGFYTDWTESELPEFLAALRNDSGESVSYPLLEITIEYKDGHQERHIALNESAIRRYEGTMTSEIFIKEEKFEFFKGDGLCISTPTGSTGLNKSLGGAIVHPRLDTIQLTEIASINNRVYRSLASPILIAKDEWIVVKPVEDHDMTGVFLSLDHLTYQISNVAQITYRVAPERVHFARYRHMHFWDRVENSFIGVKDAPRRRS